MQGDSATLTPTLAADNLNPSLGKTCNTATVAGEGARGDLTNPVEEAETRRPLWSEVLGAPRAPPPLPAPGTMLRRLPGLLLGTLQAKNLP